MDLLLLSGGKAFRLKGGHKKFTMIPVTFTQTAIKNPNISVLMAWTLRMIFIISAVMPVSYSFSALLPLATGLIFTRPGLRLFCSQREFSCNLLPVFVRRCVYRPHAALMRLIFSCFFFLRRRPRLEEQCGCGHGEPEEEIDKMSERSGVWRYAFS